MWLRRRTSFRWRRKEAALLVLHPLRLRPRERSTLWKRKISNTLAAETLAANAGVEAGDIVRTYFIELSDGVPFPKGQWEQKVAQIPQELIKDSKSLYDHWHKHGSAPSDKRLRLDTSTLRDQMEEQNVLVRWVSQEQQASLKLVFETNVAESSMTRE